MVDINYPPLLFYALRSEIWGIYEDASTTVHPSGIPVLPVVQVVFLFLTNVPLAATSATQVLVQLCAEISVARQVIELRLVQ